MKQKNYKVLKGIYINMDIVENIKRLKEQKKAIILAHYYQIPQVQDIADFVGDSFDLSKKAKNAEGEIIVFCGVSFMAESAKVLNPNKTVLLPARDAGCPMADMVEAQDVLKLREEYPQAAVVCYVNSSAQVKAVSDICCTSSNAVKVVRSLPNKQIIFVPDCNLGDFVAKQVPEKEIIFFPGFCITHKAVTEQDVLNARQAVPNTKVLVHPECRPEVVAAADFAGSTAQILEYAQKSEDKTFIIGTEQGILHILNKTCPDKKFYVLSQKLICPNMKKTTLKDVENALMNLTYEIKLDNALIEAAYKSLDRMLNVL